MAVLVEAISVVVRVDRVVRDFPGGWDGFVEAVPNRTLCSDGELARVGFMAPPDVASFVRVLERAGLVFLRDGEAVDVVVADQLKGFTSRCPWAEVGHVDIGEGSVQRIAACRLAGSALSRVATPPGWKFEGSLSQEHTFVPTERIGERMSFLRHEKGLDVYRDAVTGEERFTARTGPGGPGGGRGQAGPARWH